MTMSPGFKNFLWMMVGVAILLGVAVLAMRYYEIPDCAAQILFRARKVELIAQARQALLSSSEAEKSAVLAITDQESQTFADQSRAASALVEQKSRVLASLLETGGTTGEKELLDQFSRAFAKLQRIDDDLLALAVKNTNVKAYALAFGPGAEALKEMDDGLSRMVEESAGSTSPEAKRLMLLASVADSAALRIQTLLPPHIAEESNQKMDDLEALMAKDDQKIRRGLADLNTLLKPTESPDLKTAVSAYDRLSQIRAQILKLSRENTNVHSLAISLDQKRKAMLACQAALAALEQAIQEEPIEGMNCRTPTNPRKL